MMHIFLLKRRSDNVLRAGLIGSLLAMALPVLGDAAVSLGGAVTSTDVSGFSGTPFTLGAAPGAGVQGLYGLSSVERGDQPCYITSFTEDVNNASTDSGAIKNLCGADATSSELLVRFTDTGFAKRTFVRALRVCMNDGNDRVKGLQIRGRTIDSNGNAADLPARYPDTSQSSGLSPLVDLNAPSDERTNCSAWKRWVECPDGQIATAVVAHFGPGSTPRSLTGLALRCRSVM
jgi:hypothetical protein